MARGNVFHDLQAFLHPHVKHAVTHSFVDVVEERESEDQDDPLLHIHRQALKIQRGEEVETVTALRPVEESSH